MTRIDKTRKLIARAGANLAIGGAIFQFLAWYFDFSDTIVSWVKKHNIYGGLLILVYLVFAETIWDKRVSELKREYHHITDKLI